MRLLLALLALVPLAGCTTYEPDPLVAAAVWRELESVRLEPLRADPSRELDVAEAVALALIHNPDLRAFRRQKGIAEGELVEAGLLPNPSLQLNGLTVFPFGKETLDVFPSWQPPRPGEIEKKEARARARIDEVSAEVAAREWTLAAEVRRSYLDAIAAEEQLRIAAAALRLRTRIVDFIRARKDLGDATRVEVTLAELERGTWSRRRLAADQERTRVRLELARLLGLRPGTELPLAATLDPLTPRLPGHELAALHERMLEGRAELRAAKAVHEQEEKNLDLAYLRRWPWFRFGPAFEREAFDQGSANRWGITIGIFDIPLFHQNQGEIEIRAARRREARDRFVAVLHRSRAEVADAWFRVKANAALVELFEREVAPAVREAERLVEASFELGDVDLLRLLAVLDRSLESRSELVRERLGLAKALVDLERAVGAKLDSTP